MRENPIFQTWAYIVDYIVQSCRKVSKCYSNFADIVWEEEWAIREGRSGQGHSVKRLTRDTKYTQC